MSDTRAQLKTLVTNGVLSGGRRTIAATLRAILNAIIDADSNIQDDKDQASGYLGIGANGLVNISFIADPSPSSKYLRDDGTWQAISGGGNMDEKTIDITGKTDIDLTGESANIINLFSSNTTEAIDTITGIVNPSRLYLRPVSGLNVTFNDASINSGNIHLWSTGLTAIGSKSGYLKVETRASEFYQNEFIDQYI